MSIGLLQRLSSYIQSLLFTLHCDTIQFMDEAKINDSLFFCREAPQGLLGVSETHFENHRLRYQPPVQLLLFLLCKHNHRNVLVNIKHILMSSISHSRNEQRFFFYRHNAICESESELQSYNSK